MMYNWGFKTYMEKCFASCSYAVANLLNLHTMHLHWVKKITAATVVLIGQKRILSKQSYLKVMLPCAKPVGMPKRRSWSANLSKNRHQKHLLGAFAKIAVQWRLWWSNILATLQVQTLLLSIFSRFSKHVLWHT